MDQNEILIDKVVSEAVKQICEKLPKKINDKIDQITLQVLNNLKTNIEKVRDSRLADFTEKIKTDMKTKMEPYIEKNFIDLTKRIHENILLKDQQAVTRGGRRSIGLTKKDNKTRRFNYRRKTQKQNLKNWRHP
jgi:hypothetical protein